MTQVAFETNVSTTCSSAAYLIDVAEVGAAMGSADVTLANEIRAAHVGSRPSLVAGGETFACLDELLAGGAFADYEPRAYTEAFSLLCCHLGTPLSGDWVEKTAGYGFEPSPFDVPESVDGYSVHLIPEDVVEAALVDVGVISGSRIIAFS